MTVQTERPPTSSQLAEASHHSLTEDVEGILGMTDEDIADYTEAVVPQARRRSNFRMLAQFLSMQAVFGAVLVGYGARFQGLTLGQLIEAMLIAVAVMSIYCFGSANAGARTGQTHSVMARGVFGTLGSALVSLLLVINGMAFYLFTVIFVVSLGEALLGTIPAVSLVTAALALIMIVNNYFGFEGLVRFAQYVAVPVVALWGLYAAIRALTTVTADQLAAVPHAASSASLMVTVGAMVGLSTWGNEPDVFRYAKKGRPGKFNVPTVLVGYILGAFIFPVVGYLIATLSNEPEFSAGIRYFADFTMFGLAGVMLIVLFINQWAVQDGNLYIAINGAQNVLSPIKGWRREYTVIGLGIIAAGLTFILPSLTKTFTYVTGIGAVTVPVASTIMAIDLFVVPRLFGIRRTVARVPNWSETAFANWPGIVALLAGTLVGGYTAGLIPGVPGFGETYIGFPALQAWGTGAILYLILVALTARSARRRELLGHWA
jgi:purine-cytosine permease-like protein